MLIRAQEKDSFIVGCMAGGSMDNGVEAIAWTDGTMDITVFANSIVNRAHQQDDYLFASNAIFSEMLADEPLEFSAVTRGTLAQELYEREGKPTGGAAGFDDMAEDAAYADAVNWAASEGVMKGYSAAAFGPGDSLTREQLAVVLYRYAQKKGYELAQDGPALKDFTDGNAVSGWALEAMTWAVNTGVLTGKEDGTLAPQGARHRRRGDPGAGAPGRCGRLSLFSRRTAAHTTQREARRICAGLFLWSGAKNGADASGFRAWNRTVR